MRWTILSKAKIMIGHNVSLDRLSVSQYINKLSDRLEVEGRLSLSSCFDFLQNPTTEEEARHEVVVTFLSVLEMGKLGLIRVAQVESTSDDEEIYIESAVESLKQRLAEQMPSEDEYR